MDLSNIPSNLDFYFDDNLREVPVSTIDLIKGIEFKKKQSHSPQDNEEELAKTYGLIGVYSRIVNKIEDSKKYLSLAIEMNIQSGNHKSLFVNELRLAHTYQWETNYYKSNKLFKKLKEQSESDTEHSNYLDSVYQHYGKNLFDQSEYQLALKYVKKALRIRVEKGNKELIDSTEYAINICNEKIKQIKE
ncbi:tetratricopeptide repeat protein [Halalkalibacterium halodurans]|uniref:tetratricopeptide repeat protein n=1 Tax=Halalkalibacterium halodurans TaxID=86665 RepID=UPI002AA9A3C2|nr:tetratricopeptide repeat protein [Halalkalibacterium halodurans]MDY7223264.1 tetratricopeptide repeat protein [Halalkalibacterium halodurans]MDY7242485.1 tetratricopeptide repeat protein [Halalkalibacterium halodurans]